MSCQDDLKKLIINYRHRLQNLEEQEALRGWDTPPHIIEEIKEIKAKIKRLEAELEESKLVSNINDKARVRIYIDATLSQQSLVEVVDNFAATIGLARQQIEIYRVYQRSTILELGIPPENVEQLCALLRSNSSKLHKLKIIKVDLWGESEEEKWVVEEGKFKLETFIPLVASEVDTIKSSAVKANQQVLKTPVLSSQKAKLTQAKQLYRQGNLEMARDVLEALIFESNIPSEAIHALFKIYADQRSDRRAERTYQKLLGNQLSENQLYTLHLCLARTQRDCLNYARSLELVEQAIKLKPSTPEAYDLLIDVHENSSSLPEAVKLLWAQLEQQPSHPGLYTILARACSKLGWWPETEEAAKEAVQLNKGIKEASNLRQQAETELKANPEHFRAAAERQYQHNDSAAASRYLIEWAKTTNEAADFVTVGEWCEQCVEFGKAEYAFSQAVHRQKDHGRARAGLNRARRRKKPPLVLDKPKYDADELTQLTDWFIEGHDFLGGIGFLRRYLQSHPNFVPSLRLLALLYQKIDLFDESFHALQEAIDKSYDNAKPELYCELGDLYLSQDQADLAKQSFQTALRYDSGYQPARDKLKTIVVDPKVPRGGVLHEYWKQARAAGRYQEALDYFLSLREKDPQRHDLHVLISYAYVALDQIDKAYDAQQWATLLKNDDDAYVKLGLFCLRNKLYEQAEKAFQEALKRNPNNDTARRRLLVLPKASPILEQLKARPVKPDYKYLRAINNFLQQQTWPQQEIAKYFAALAGDILDDPDLFNLLGEAYKHCGEAPAAAVAYRHKARLKGEAKEYGRLADFCQQHQPLVKAEMAVNAYQDALRLNPFYPSVKGRLTYLPHDQALPTHLITGDGEREWWAENMVESPANNRYAVRLRQLFIDNQALVQAEDTYRTLQRFHPTQLTFRRDLAEVYLAGGKPDQAWLEAKRALQLEEATVNKNRNDFEAILHRAEEALAKLGTQPPALPSYDLPNVVNQEMPEIAYEWLTLLASQKALASPFEQLIAEAQNYEAQIDPAPATDLALLPNFLQAAACYQAANRSDDALRNLINYTRIQAHYLRTRGEETQAQAWAIKAIRLIATFTTNRPLLQEAKLMHYLVDYLIDQSKASNNPDQWSPAAFDEVRQVLTAGQMFMPPKLSRLLGHLQAFLLACRQPANSGEFEGSVHWAAIMRYQLKGLPAQPGQRLAGLLERWLTRLPQPVKTQPDRANLQFDLPRTLSLAEGGNVLELKVTVINRSQTPADCLWITLTLGPEFNLAEPKQFIPFLPGQGSEVVSFQITNIPTDFGYIKFKLNLSYFDPVQPQITAIAAVRTIKREDRPFKPIKNPYHPSSWPSQHPITLSYLTPDQAERLLRTPAAQNARLSWSTEAIEQALALTAGEKVTLETLAFLLVDHLNELERSPAKILVEDIEAVIASISTRPDYLPYFVALVKDEQTLSPIDKFILACLAAYTDDATTWVRRDELWQTMERLGYRLSVDELSARTARLESQLSILEVGTGLNSLESYRFRVQLFHTWLRHHWRSNQALVDLRQAQRQERLQQAVVLRQKLAETIALERDYQTRKAEHDRGNMDLGQFSRYQQYYVRQFNELMFEIRGILTEQEYVEINSFLSQLIVADASDHDVLQQELQTIAQQRGWSETQVQERLGTGQDLITQLAYFILDTWKT